MSKRKKFAMTAICGNEERWAKGWSQSVMKTNPDVIVINLTQFDDNTEEILRANLPKEKLILVKNKWCKSFAQARNECLAHVPDDVDYCAFLDLDEEWVDKSIPLIEELLHSDQEPMLVLVNIYNAVQEKNLVASLFYPRIWMHKDKDGKLVGEFFESDVHNQLIVPQREKYPTVRSQISIMHYGYALDAVSMKKKHERSEELLRNQIEEDNDSFFPHLNLAQLLRAKGDYIGTEKHAREVLRIIEPKIELGEKQLEHARIMAFEQWTTALLAKRDYEQALEKAKQTLEFKSDHLDSIMNAGSACLEMRKYDDAIFWFKRYLFVRSRYDETMDNTNLILNHLNSSFIALYNLGTICMIQNKFADAFDYFEKSNKESKDFRDIFVKTIHCLRMLGKTDELHKRVNAYMMHQSEKAFAIYEYFGDTEMENCNVENAKFNYYQAAHLGTEKRMQDKWDTLKNLFGDVSSNYFDTSKKNEQMQRLT